VKTVDHVVILQTALARLVADRTIDRMIDQQKLKHTSHCFLYAIVIGAHNHPVVDDRRASRCQFRHLFDFDQAHSAVAVDRQIDVIAIERNLDAVILSSLNDSLPGLGFDLLSV
jgi:hypothetical protein